MTTPATNTPQLSDPEIVVYFPPNPARAKTEHTLAVLLLLTPLPVVLSNYLLFQSFVINDTLLYGTVIAWIPCYFLAMTLSNVAEARKEGPMDLHHLITFRSRTFITLLVASFTRRFWLALKQI